MGFVPRFGSYTDNVVRCDEQGRVLHVCEKCGAESAITPEDFDAITGQQVWHAIVDSVPLPKQLASVHLQSDGPGGDIDAGDLIHWEGCSVPVRFVNPEQAADEPHVVPAGG